MERLKQLMCFLAVLATPWLISCSESADEPVSNPKATLQFSPFSLLTGDEEEPDYAVSSLRVLIFSPGSYTFYNFPIDLSTAIQPYTIQIDQGTYDFVFIANEDSDPALAAELANYNVSNTLSELAGKYFDSASIRNNYTIPMTRIYRNVRVAGNNEVYLNGSSTKQETPWPVEVDRASIRVDLFMETTDETMVDGFTSLQVANVPNKVYLLPENLIGQRNYNVTGSSSFETLTASVLEYRSFDNDEGDAYAYRGPTENDVDYTIKIVNPGLSFTKESDGKWHWYKRIILPETVFADKTDEDSGIELQVMVYDQTYRLTLSNQAETDFTIPRNVRYKVTGTLTANYITFEVSVKPWGKNENQDIPLE